MYVMWLLMYIYCFLLSAPVTRTRRLGCTQIVVFSVKKNTGDLRCPFVDCSRTLKNYKITVWVIVRMRSAGCEIWCAALSHSIAFTIPQLITRTGPRL